MKKIICYFVIMCFSMACPGMAVLPAAIAAELSGEEQTVSYSKEVLQEILQSIKNNLTEGLSNATELTLLESVRDELTAAMLKAESMADEVRETLPDSHIAEFEINFEEKMSGLRNLIEEIDNIIINDPVSIEQIDTVLDLIEVLDPEVQGEVLAAKPVLPNRVDKSASVFKERLIKPTGAPVTEADLAATEDIIITPAIEELALKLGNDVVTIFTWVRNNIDYEPYYGSMKGSVETLADMAGNDCDSSSLLLALLRAAGIPSRYVRGDVELKIEDLMNWVGAKTPEAAVAILQRNKIPVSIIYKFDTIGGIIFDHTWVEAFDGHNWRLMDPSFKTYVYTEGVGFDISEEDMDAIIEASASFVNEAGDRILMDYGVMNDILETQAANYENSVGNLNINEIFGKRKIFITEKNNLPPYLARGIIGDRKPAEEFSEMPEDMRFKMKAVLPGGYEYTTSLSEIAGKRVSVVYVPATVADQSILDLYGGIYNVPFPSLLVKMKPVLQVDGETVAAGTSTGLGLSDQYVQIGFLRPCTTGEWEFTNKPLTAGNRYNVYITTQRTSLDELGRLSKEALIVAEESGLSGTDQITNDMLDENLRMVGMFYFGSVDAFSDYASKSLNIVPVGHVSMGYICDEINPSGFLGVVWSIAKAGLHIDVVRSVKCPTSAIGNKADEVTWMKAYGLVGTNMEHAMIEVFYGSKAVSTGMIFAEAAKQGIPIHVLDNSETLEADLAVISANSVVKNHIRTYVNAGYTAMIPQHNITVGSWSGQGWFVIDEETGAAGYMICGGLHGGNTMVNGGSGTTIIDHPFSPLETLLWLLIPSAGAISAGLGHIVAAQTIFELYMFAAPFCLIGCVIGLAFIAVALVTFIVIFSNYPLVYLIRRREYEYA